MGAETARRRRGVGWASVVCAATIILAIGGPLIGRGLLIGSDIIRTVPPWSADTPTSFVYRHGGINDTVDAGAPAREAIRQALVDDHRLELWDQYPNGGAPLGSVPNSGALAPLNWPLLLLGVSHGLAWAALLRLAVAAIGTYFLLGRLGVSRFAGVCGGLIYCTSGFVIAWNNYPQANIAAMIPLLFFAADVLRERRRVTNVLGVTAVVAAMLLEGYLPLFLITMYALAAFLVVRWWESSRGDAPDRPSLASRLRAAVTPAGLLIGGFALGAALVAAQLVPMALGLGDYDLSYREVNSARVISPASLITSAFPWAQGSPAHPASLAVVHPEIRRHIINFIEQFAFLGAVAVVLALLAVLLGRPSRVSRGVYRYCLSGTALLLLVLFGRSVGPLPDIGAVATDALYLLPGMNQVPLPRLIALLLFFATLIAAFGIEHIVAPERQRLRPDRKLLIRGGAAVAFLAYVSYPAVRDQIEILVNRTGIDSRGEPFQYLGSQRSWIVRNSFVPALLVIATIIVIIGARRGKSSWRTIALGALPVLLAVEGLMVTVPMLPRVAASDYYPQTGATRYLAAELDHERVAPAGTGMLYYATNTMYGLRSVSGHSFNTRNWHDLITATQPDYQLMLQNRLGQSLATATSPILDRLGARFFVASPAAVPFGTLEPASPPAGSLTITNQASATGTVAAGPLRAIEVPVLGRVRLRGDLVYLDVDVRTPSGTSMATGRRRLRDQHATSTYSVPVTGEDLDATTPLEVRVGLHSDAGDAVRLGATDTGQVSLGAVRPADDGLRLTYADAGAVVYRRLTALPRIRWAGRTKVVSASQSVAALTQGVPADTVVLAKPGPAAQGAPAKVTVDEDSGDKIRVQVDASRAGYLVVADSIQSGWQARLDGRTATLRNADDAVVAVHVPKGRHTIELVARPRGWRAGIALTVAAIAIIIGLLLWVVIRRNRRAHARPSTTTGPAPDPA